ncbi:MAG: hypothetical protein AAF517_24615, partial [Planctomycetota bacterium]
LSLENAATSEAEDDTGSMVSLLVVVFVLLGLVQAAILIFRQSRKVKVTPRQDRRSEAGRPKAAPPEPAQRPAPPRANVRTALDRLCGDFDVALAALAWLDANAAQDPQALKAALADQRLTPFQKIRGSGGRLTAIPVETHPNIQVRHVAKLLISRLRNA